MIGVIGLGNMGLSMAINLQQKGESILGYDISSYSQEKAKQENIVLCDTLAELIEQSRVLILSLPKAEHVLETCLGAQGIIAHPKNGLLVVDTSTSTPEASRQIAQIFCDKGMTFVDAPVSGGPAGAISGTMSMVVGSSEQAYKEITPILDKMSAKHLRVGEVGAGNITKLGNNLLVAANLLLVAEMVSMAARSGVDSQAFLRGVNQGSGRSAVSEINFEKWILSQAYDSGFTMGLMRKDVALAQNLLHDNLVLSQQVTRLWRDSLTLKDELDFNAIVQKVDEELFKKY